MDYKLPRASKRSYTPDTEEHNGLKWQNGIVTLTLEDPLADYLSHGGNESTENFRRVVRPFIHEDRGHSSQVLQPSVDQSAGSVATEVATSVDSSRNDTMSPSAIKTENQDLPPLNARKRVVDSTLPRKQRRHSSSASQIQGCSQLATQVHRKRPLTLTTVSRNLVSDTIRYLQTLSDRMLISDTISSKEWATMHLATQLLQGRYEDIIAREEMETNDVPEFAFPPTQPEEKCRKCGAADEDRLYD